MDCEFDSGRKNSIFQFLKYKTLLTLVYGEAVFYISKKKL